MQYTVIRQHRKTAVIVINEKQEVVVKVPYAMTERQITDLVDEHQQWIEKTLARKKQQMDENDWYITGRQLYLGTYWPVRVKTVYDHHYMAVFNKELGFVLMTDGSEACARSVMEKFYRTRAKELIEPIALKYAKLLGEKYQKITIRKQVTRWGSCSSIGNLSFNMKILCAPMEMIEYVVLHEIAHLKHFNHSSAFWHEVERWMPDYMERMNYFRQFGKNFII